MPTPHQIIASNVNTILDKAAALDQLVTQFRTIAVDVEQSEGAIRKAMVELNGDVILPLDGQQRLAHYAHMRMVNHSPSKTVSDLAATAWGSIA